jgi:hypothetical protein
MCLPPQPSVQSRRNTPINGKAWPSTTDKPPLHNRNTLHTSKTCSLVPNDRSHTGTARTRHIPRCAARSIVVTQRNHLTDSHHQRHVMAAPNGLLVAGHYCRWAVGAGNRTPKTSCVEGAIAPTGPCQPATGKQCRECPPLRHRIGGRYPTCRWASCWLSLIAYTLQGVG